MKNPKNLVKLYKELKLAHYRYRNHKIVHDQLRGSSPKPHNLHKERTHKLQKKVDLHFQLVTNAMIHMKNIQSKWEQAMDKLTENEKRQLELAIVADQHGVQ